MRCENCRFLTTDGTYECTFVCEMFGEDIPKDFDFGDGCCLHYKEVSKLLRLKDECMSHNYYGIRAFIEERPLNKEEIKESKKLEIANKKYNVYFKHLKQKYSEGKK